MKGEKIKEELESYINGNITEFKQFLKKCNKVDLLHAIEFYKEMTNKDYVSILYDFRIMLRLGV